MTEDTSRYNDIIHLPHPVSRKRPPMPMESRAAQFSPFAAVAGHEETIHETAREYQDAGAFPCMLDFPGMQELQPGMSNF